MKSIANYSQEQKIEQLASTIRFEVWIMTGKRIAVSESKAIAQRALEVADETESDDNA